MTPAHAQVSPTPTPPPNPARFWEPGTPITGGQLTAPTNNIQVALGALVNCSVTTAADVDKWRTEWSPNGTEADRIIYSWSSNGGSFSSPGSASTSWTAPSTPGTYTLTCTVYDEAIITPNDVQSGTTNPSSTRTDPPVVRTVNVVVMPAPTWFAGPSIGVVSNTSPVVYNGRMIAPQDQRGRSVNPGTPDSPESVTVSPGQVINCQVEIATDNDKKVATVPGGQDVTTYPLDGTVTYKWSAERNGTQVGGFADPDSDTTTWTAPAVEGTYTVYCALDDPWTGTQTGVTAPDTGTKNDTTPSGEAPVVRSVRVNVARVRFAEDKSQAYGFDDFTNPELPAKSIAINSTDTALAQFTTEAANVGSVFFDSNSPNIADINPKQAVQSPQPLTLSAGSIVGSAMFNAKTGSATGSVAAKMKGVSFEPLSRKVGIVLVHEENDDVQVIPVSLVAGAPDQICVSAGANDFRDTVPNRKPDGTINSQGDDAVSADGKSITTGANGICETTANSSNILSRDADRAAIATPSTHIQAGCI